MEDNDLVNFIFKLAEVHQSLGKQALTQTKDIYTTIEYFILHC